MVITKNVEAKNIDSEKLVKNASLLSLDFPAVKSMTKKRVRRIAVPYIRKHQVRGKVYFTFARGIDREVYLGTAEVILRAVKEYKTRQTRQQGRQ